MLRAIAVALAFALSGLGATAQEAVQRGRLLVEQHCAGCHAAAAEGASPLAPAPPLRSLGRRYPVRDLEEALAEGIVTGHPDMPELAFEPLDVGAIIAYLESIQDR